MRVAAAFVACLIASAAGSLAQAADVSRREPSPAWDILSDTWVATDGLGRKLPTVEECGNPRSGKFVGVFYFLWIGSHGRDLYDISKLLRERPDDPAYGPRGAFHWWGEPLFGHYRCDDPWVIRKHAQMLRDAGVDVLFFDVTNAFTYDETCLAVCRVLSEMRAAGMATPQIAFLANSRGAKTVQHLYENFYAKNRYPELWFRWQGKPLVLSPPEGLSPEVRDFFTIRHSWAWSNPKGWYGDGKDKWPWIDHYPQKPGWHESPQKPEQISVGVAQHPVSNIGRSFHNGAQPPADRLATDRGLCFAEQWRQAHRIDPSLVFVTGWNEWIAQRFISDKGGQPFMGKRTPPGGTYFVDQFNQEFSRDIEPMRGGHGDNYYYQMVAGIRKFKGVRPIPAVASRPVVIDGKFEDWTAVAPEFRDDLGDTVHRNHPGYGPVGNLTNATGRNDLTAAKVSFDDQTVYFYVQTRKSLTAPTDPNWMTLLIDVDQDAATGWLGYDLAINRTSPSGNSAAIERFSGGKFQAIADRAPLRFADSAMELSVPRGLLGIQSLPASFDFKWVDNVPCSGDATGFTLYGDAAPNDRYNYRAKLQP